jgi:polysaccharide export outer membrane protein
VSRLSRYFKDPQVTVRIQAFRSGRIYVDGEVTRPGLQAINDIPATLPDIIGRAGGFTALADRSTVAVSRNGSTTVINMQQLTAFGINPASILLGSGDLVRVLSRDESKVYVMGDVLRSIGQPLRNGRLTLNEALGEAGGVNPTTGDPRQIYVVRSTQGTSPRSSISMAAHPWPMPWRKASNSRRATWSMWTPRRLYAGAVSST